MGTESNQKIQLEHNPNIIGLQNFKQQLEKFYFVDVSIRNLPSLTNRVNLVIELDCTYSLKEVLYFLKENTLEKAATRITSPIYLEFKKLCIKNPELIDIEELSIFFNDTSIIIKRIFQNSIPNQLKNIFKDILGHYNQYTKQNSDIPFEIFIPVIEEAEDQFNNNSLLSNSTNSSPNYNYCNYWGLYYDSHNAAIIYDLKGKSLFNAKLDLLDDYF